MPAAPERERALEARGARADHEDPLGLRNPVNVLRMPAAPPFLAGGRVLSAAHRHAVVPARDTDVASDALADLIEAPFLDLTGQERICDRGAGPADEIEDTAANLRNHGVGRGEAAHADD